MPKKSTPMLPGFQYETRGRKRLSYQTVQKRVFSKIMHLNLHELSTFFAKSMNCDGLLGQSDSGLNSRKRIFTLNITFWSYFAQIVNGAACKEAVYMVQNWLRKKGISKKISSCNSAYVKARQRLELRLLYKVFFKIRNSIISSTDKSNLLFGRQVKVVDGTSIRIPDSPENLEEFPLKKDQRKGVSYPIVNLCGLFDLASGVALNWWIGDKTKSELTLWQKLWKSLSAGDIILGDRAYCGHAIISHLKATKNVDHVVRINSQMSWKGAKKIAPNQWIYSWKKKGKRSALISKNEWERLPDELEVRIIKCRIYEDGIRGHEVTILTTLVDPIKYPAEAIAKMYQKRWDVELYFRDIKTSMKMEFLNSRKPKSVKREIIMFMISYNLIRAKIIEASSSYKCDISKVSFKGTCQALIQLLPFLIEEESKKIVQLNDIFLEQITNNLLPKRTKPRVEPRVKKRREKRTPYMMSPRAELQANIMMKLMHKSLIKNA